MFITNNYYLQLSLMSVSSNLTRLFLNFALFEVGKCVAGFLCRSQVIGLLTQKVSQTLVKANLRPKNFCLGLIRPKVSFYKCLGHFLYW